jgi:hypothetical protein
VLALSAEDNPADTVVPRLERLGADLRRDFVWERDRDDEDWPWRLPAQGGGPEGRPVRRTLERAKAGLDVRCRRGTAPSGRPVSYWHLPDQEAPPVRSGCPEFDRLIAEQEKLFPPWNPLDAREPEFDDEGE